MTAKQTTKENAYYNDEDIAQLLGITVGRLRNKVSAGLPLPTRIQPPRCRNRLWPQKAACLAG